MIITNRIDAISYVRTALGEPVICVEVADVQILNIIDDVLSDLYRLLFGEATIKDYMAVYVQGGQDTYIFPPEVVSVGRIYNDNTGHSVNALFTPEHNFLYNDIMKMSGQNANSRAYNLTNFYINMQTIDSMQFMFEKRSSVLWSQWESKAKIIPAPAQDGLALFSVWKKVPEAALFNNDFFKKLLRARTMMQWGLHMKKYSTTLPGGGTMNGSEIFNDGKTLEQETLDQMKKEQYFTLMEIA